MIDIKKLQLKAEKLLLDIADTAKMASLFNTSSTDYYDTIISLRPLVRDLNQIARTLKEDERNNAKTN